MGASAWWSNVRGDVRVALRGFTRTPGFALVAVLSLALGIGANTAIFSLVNGILLRSLPLPDPQELRVLTWTGTNPRSGGASPNIGLFSGAMNQDGAGHAEANAVSDPVFEQLREAVRPLADVFAYHKLGSATVRTGRLAFVADGAMVSDNYFTALRVRPLLGRLPSAEDGRDGASLVVAISYALWQREYGGDPAVLGRTLEINNRALTVIGVLPSGFTGMHPADDLAFYVPLSAQPALSTGGGTSWARTSPDVWWLELGARVRPGAGPRLEAGLNLAFARAADGIMTRPRLVVQDGRRGPVFGREAYRKPLLLLLAVVGLVLLVACANLAGLMLARGAGRQHELALRAAIGASRWRLARQSLTESLTLAVLGAGLGVLCATWGRTALARLLSGSPDGLHYDTSLDLTVLGFTVATALVTAALSGLLPAWRAARTDAAAGLRERTALAAPRLRVGRLLVIVQIALTLLLVTGAGLYVRTLVNLVHIDPGFRTENLLLFRLDAAARGYHGDQATAYYDRVQQAVRPIAGVRSVALMDVMLLNGWMNGGGGFEVVGHTAPAAGGTQGPLMPPGGGPGAFAYRLTVNETFFGTMGIPLLLGRGFREGDIAGAPRVVVVNQAFVRRYLDGQNALGQVIRQHYPSDVDWQIVGVCRDARYDNIRLEPPPTIYYSFRQNPPGGAVFALRTSLPPMSLAPAVRRAVAAVDPSVPLANVTTQTLIVQRSTSQQRLFATLCSALALLAVLLACIGLYGLVAYNVTRRTGELGIRAALGASRRQLQAPILRETLLLAGAGTLLGLPLTFFLVKLIRSQLYGVEPHDPLTLLAALCGLFLIALAAGWLPVRRAGRLDPMTALRSE